MAQEPKEEIGALNTLLSNYHAFVTYQPLRTEVAFLNVITLPKEGLVHEIPPRAALDPLAEAARVRELIGGRATAILLPGRSFDASGTRLGQGGGWYDRFLANVPREWLRIGFCYEDQFSSTPLVRESWDQAMDYVAVANRANGSVTLYSSEGDLNHD